MSENITRFRDMRKLGKKGLAVLLDPDKVAGDKGLMKLIELIHPSDADFIFVGGSLLVSTEFDFVIQRIHEKSKIPVIIFPGNPSQVSPHADAILLLSLISGRNADLLIGQHVVAAPSIRKAELEVISTGYMLVDCGRATTASYVSQTFPIPYDKPEIAAVTAMASEMLGHHCIYLDGGSGAQKPVSAEMIAAVRATVQLPLIVGGGIRDEQQVRAAYASGADIVVVGTAFEEEPELLFAFAQSRTA